MRRSARISAKRGLAVPSVQIQAPETARNEDISAVDEVTRKEPEWKAGETQRIGGKTNRSARKNTAPVDICKVEADASTSVGNIPQTCLIVAKNTTKGRLEISKSREISNLVSDSVVKSNESRVACDEAIGENEGQSYKSSDYQTLQKVGQKSKRGKSNLLDKINTCKEQAKTTKEKDPSLNESISGFDLKMDKPHENESFKVISKKEIDLNIDTCISENNIEEETNKSAINIKDERINNECTENLTGLDFKTSGNPPSGINQALPITNQPSSQERNSLGKKHPKIQNIRKLTFSNSSLQNNSSNRNLLKLTSEVFQKIPFKITKEDLLTNKLPKGNRSKRKLTSCNGENDVDEDVLQRDIISVTVGQNEIPGVNKKKFTLSSELDPRIQSNDLYFKVKQNGAVPNSTELEESSKKKERKILKKSVIGPDFEQKEHSYTHESKAQKMKRRKREAEETAGKGWYNLPKTEMTKEVKRDMQLLKMRSVLDPKRFYKRGEKRISKYFQVGTVVSGAADFYSSRLPKKDRKRSMVDQLLADAEFRRRNKRKYLEIQEKRANSGGKFRKKRRNKKKEKRGRT